MVSSLDDLEEEGWAILGILCENLEEVTFLVVVNQDLVLSQNLNVFLDFKTNIFNAFLKSIVVRVGDLIQELNTTSLHALNCGDDILSTHGDVLHTSTLVVVAVLLNLGLTHTISGLVDWHLDVLVKVSNDN
jgi:hypothetical protein